MGEAWVFDDTIEHEAWNDADETRVILIFDIWNPLLSETERELISVMLREHRQWLAQPPLPEASFRGKLSWPGLDQARVQQAFPQRVHAAAGTGPEPIESVYMGLLTCIALAVVAGLSCR